MVVLNHYRRLILMPEYLLDTNAVSAQMKGDQVLITLLDTATKVAIPSIVIGELLYGAAIAQRGQVYLNQIESLIATKSILSCDVETARFYSQIASQLHRTGKLISPNDIWIAALAFQYRFVLLTRDTDFQRVDGLNVQGW